LTKIHIKCGITSVGATHLGSRRFFVKLRFEGKYNTKAPKTSRLTSTKYPIGSHFSFPNDSARQQGAPDVRQPCEFRHKILYYANIIPSTKQVKK